MHYRKCSIISVSKYVHTISRSGLQIKKNYIILKLSVPLLETNQAVVYVSYNRTRYTCILLVTQFTQILPDFVEIHFGRCVSYTSLLSRGSWMGDFYENTVLQDTAQRLYILIFCHSM